MSHLEREQHNLLRIAIIVCDLTLEDILAKGAVVDSDIRLIYQEIYNNVKQMGALMSQWLATIGNTGKIEIGKKIGSISRILVEHFVEMILQDKLKRNSIEASINHIESLARLVIKKNSTESVRKPSAEEIIVIRPLETTGYACLMTDVQSVVTGLRTLKFYGNISSHKDPLPTFEVPTIKIYDTRESRSDIFNSVSLYEMANLIFNTSTKITMIKTTSISDFGKLADSDTSSSEEFRTPKPRRFKHIGPPPPPPPPTTLPLEDMTSRPWYLPDDIPLLPRNPTPPSQPPKFFTHPIVITKLYDKLMRQDDVEEKKDSRVLEVKSEGFVFDLCP